MLDPSNSPGAAPCAVGSARECAAYCEFVEAWRRGETPRLEQAIARLDAADRAALLPDFIAADVFYRHQRGERPSREDYERVLGADALAVASTFPNGPAASTQLSHGTDPVLDSRASTIALPHGAAELKPQREQVVRSGPSLGRYQLCSVLGRGGFGMVWLAHDSLLDRQVAIKIPHVHGTAGDQARREMIEEARRVARLNLPGVVPVYDFCEVDGHPFVVSRYMEGGTLTALIERKRVSFVEAAQLVAQIAGTLHQAHLRNIVHRDIKPGNILLDESGAPWVADFGLAVTEDEQEAEPQSVMGTYAYMSPEQARGENRFLDARSDIYSLGMVLYELLTGRVAFHASTANNLLEQIGHRPPRPPRTINDAVPLELERVCLKCLAKDVDQRYSTASDLAADLDQWLQDQAAEPAVAEKTGISQIWLYVAGGLLALVLGGVLLAASGWLPGYTSRNPAPVDGNSVIVGPAPKYTTELPKFDEPNRWHNLLAREPFRLAGVGEASEISWNPRQRILQASVVYPTLIELGRTDESNYELRIRIRQNPWTGSVGLFLGHGSDDVAGSPTVNYRLIHLSVKHPAKSPDFALFRSMLTQEKSGLQAVVLSNGLAFQDVLISGPSSVLLEVEVRGGAIVRVTFGGANCVNLITDPAVAADPGNCVGPFGLYLSNSSVVVETAEYRFSR